MIAQLLFYKIAQFFVIMLIGFLLVKSKLIKGEDSVVLSKINLFLLMPAAIIGSFVLENRSPEVLGGIALAFAGAFAIHGVFLVVDFFYKKLFRTGKVERTSVFYSNSGNMILPIVGFVMGEEWVIYSAAYLSVQQLFLWTHCVSIFESRKKIELKKIVSNINVIAIAIGALIMIFNLRLPEFADNIMSSFSGMLGPVSMLITGMLAARIDYGKILKNSRLYRSIAMRLVVCPLIVLMLMRGALAFVNIAHAKEILLISYLASITPAASAIVQFSQIYKEDVDLAVAINVLTTALCIITMPMFVMLYQL